MPSSPAQRVMVVVPTHTTRHLACCLASLLTQTDPPDAVCLSIDNTDPEIPELARNIWTTGGAGPRPPLLITGRAHRDVASLNQVRNNALRALDRVLGLNDEDLVVVVDGDTALHPAALGIHRRTEAGIITAYRYDLTESATAGITPHQIQQGALASVERWTTTDQRRALKARHSRHEKQVRIRSTPVLRAFQKPHKPKLLGGHHSVRAGLLRVINGYDEAYVGYGYDDDDLASRLNQLRPRPRWAVVTNTALAFHLWHPTRAPARPTAAPGYAIFSQRRVARAQLGWDSPDEQAEPQVETIR